VRRGGRVGRGGGEGGDLKLDNAILSLLFVHYPYPVEVVFSML